MSVSESEKSRKDIEMEIGMRRSADDDEKRKLMAIEACHWVMDLSLDCEYNWKAKRHTLKLREMNEKW